MPLPYVLPTFNINVTVWHYPKEPGDADDGNFAAQFYIRTQQNNDNEWSGRVATVPPTWLRCPLGSDILTLDIVEVPTGSGRYYFCGNVDIAHLGFANAYKLALLSQAYGVVFGDDVLMETGDFVLTETGDRVLME